MAQQPNPKNVKPVSLSGKPRAFKHVKNARPEFMMAATGEREKAKKRAELRAKAPKLNKQFAEAHEGPREKLAYPKQQAVPTPRGGVTKEVHAQVEQEKRNRNRQKDLQMKAWRERKVTKPSRVAHRNPMLKKTQPDVLLKAGKKRSVEQILQAKQAKKQLRRRSR